MRHFQQCLIAFFLLITGLSICSAHEGRPVYLQLKQTQAKEYLLQWKIPPVMPDENIPHIDLKDDSCSLYAGENTTRLMGKKAYQCESENPNIALTLKYPVGNPGLSTLVIFQRLEGNTSEIFAGPEQQIIHLPEKASFFGVARQYLTAGIKHILAGYDHLLFVLCLLVISGTLRRIMITITGFTLAHSVTLALASFDIIRLPIPFVETLIALSILLLAAEIIKNKRHTLAWRYPIGMATVFGLLHGFGFASVLGELNLPQTMKLNALVFFNIGVELGQLIFSSVVLFLTISFKRTMIDIRMQYTLISRTGIYFVGVLSAYWLIERCLGIFYKILLVI